MATVLTLHGINFADGSTNKLISNINGIFRVYNSSTQNWDSVGSFPFTSGTLIDSTNFLNHAFFVNGTDSNLSYNSSGTWSASTNLGDSPKGKYIEHYDVRLYILNVVIRGTSYRSRIWYSDLPKNGAITWGLETGTNLAQTAASAVVTSAGSTFITNNIKVGDPFTIESGTNAGEYTVRTIDSETQITLTAALTNTTTNSNFWVGGNFIDVETDDGDVLTGVGKNSNELVFFKRLSLHRYSSRSGTLRRVREIPGTGSFRSIVNSDAYTYYHDPTTMAIRRYDGSDSIVISNAIEDLLENMDSSMIDNVVGWETDGKLIEWYIGTTTTRDGQTVSNCVISFDTTIEGWSSRSLPWAIEQSAEWVQSSQPKTFLATDSAKCLKVADGYKYDTTDIAFFLQDRPIFPVAPDILVDITKIRVFTENGHDLQLAYRMLYTIESESTGNRTHTEWNTLKGSSNADMVEFIIPEGKPRRGGGIEIRFIQSSGTESFLLEKYVVYYANASIL